MKWILGKSINSFSECHYLLSITLLLKMSTTIINKIEVSRIKYLEDRQIYLLGRLDILQFMANIMLVWAEVIQKFFEVGVVLTQSSFNLKSSLDMVNIHSLCLKFKSDKSDSNKIID